MVMTPMAAVFDCSYYLQNAASLPACSLPHPPPRTPPVVAVVCSGVGDLWDSKMNT